MAEADTAADVKSTNRGPNFPSISLPRAIELAELLYAKEKRNFVPAPVALAHWGYKNPKSSSATMAMAAMRSFGMLDFQASGEARQAKLSQRALRIILKTPERDAELKAAALAPKIHQQIWDKYNGELPSDESLRHHLIFDLDFNDTAIDAFLARFRQSIALANLTSGDKMSEKLSENDSGGGSVGNQGSGNVRPKIGDAVQWESQGAMQFPEARLITGFSEDGQWVFVEGTSSGLPIAEISVVQRSPASQKGTTMSHAAPPAPPYAPPPAMIAPLAPPGPGIKTETFSLDRGEIVVRFPSAMTADDFENIKAWLPILERKFSKTVLNPE